MGGRQEDKIRFIKDRHEKTVKHELRRQWCKEFYGDRNDGIPEQKFGYFYGQIDKGFM